MNSTNSRSTSSSRRARPLPGYRPAHHADTADKRVGDRAHVDGTLRSPVGTDQRAPPAIRGGTIDDEEHVGRMESVYREWSGAVAPLRLMVRSSGRDPMHFVLHSGRIGGGTYLAAQGLPDLKIQPAERWKSRACDVCERGRGGSRCGLHCTREKRRVRGSGWPYGASVR